MQICNANALPIRTCLNPTNNAQKKRVPEPPRLSGSRAATQASLSTVKIQTCYYSHSISIKFNNSKTILSILTKLSNNVALYDNSLKIQILLLSNER